MLQYRRRNSTEPIPDRRTIRHPLLTYTNWSYDQNQHLDTQRLRQLLREFDETYGHIYIRLFNEVPRDIILSFMQQEGIDESRLVHIYHAMNRLGADLRPY